MTIEQITGKWLYERYREGHPKGRYLTPWDVLARRQEAWNNLADQLKQLRTFPETEGVA
jgi:hypothetical protein